MAHDALTKLIDSVRFRLPGALDDIIKHEAAAVFDEFFRGTNAWQEDIPVEVQPGTLTYEIPAPNHVAQVVRLLHVSNADEIPVNASMPVVGELLLRLEPSSVQTYTVRVSLTAVELEDNEQPAYPEWILETYRDDLFDGLLGRMMSQPAKPYSNERMAIYHLRRFRNAMAKARVATQHHNVVGGQKWRFPRAFTGR